MSDGPNMEIGSIRHCLEDEILRDALNEQGGMNNCIRSLDQHHGLISRGMAMRMSWTCSLSRWPARVLHSDSLCVQLVAYPVSASEHLLCSDMEQRPKMTFLNGSLLTSHQGQHKKAQLYGNCVAYYY